VLVAFVFRKNLLSFFHIVRRRIIWFEVAQGVDEILVRWRRIYRGGSCGLNGECPRYFMDRDTKTCPGTRG